MRSDAKDFKSVTGRVVALFDYEAGDDGEISFSEGDVMDLLSNDSEWWVVSRNGKCGWIPSNYVEMLREMPHPEARALYAYEKQDKTELSLKEGRLYEVLDMDDSGWWKVRRKKKSGMVPSNYLQFVSKGSENLKVPHQNAVNEIPLDAAQQPPQSQWQNPVGMMQQPPQSQWQNPVGMMQQLPQSQWQNPVGMMQQLPQSQWQNPVGMMQQLPQSQWQNPVGMMQHNLRQDQSEMHPHSPNANRRG